MPPSPTALLYVAFNESVEIHRRPPVTHTHTHKYNFFTPCVQVTAPLIMQGPCMGRGPPSRPHAQHALMLCHPHNHVSARAHRQRRAVQPRPRDRRAHAAADRGLWRRGLHPWRARRTVTDNLAAPVSCSVSCMCHSPRSPLATGSQRLLASVGTRLMGRSACAPQGWLPTRPEALCCTSAPRMSCSPARSTAGRTPPSPGRWQHRQNGRLYCAHCCAALETRLTLDRVRADTDVIE